MAESSATTNRSVILDENGGQPQGDAPEREIMDQPPIAEFYLRLDDGRLSRGRTGIMYSWNFDDWHLLRNCHALDIEEFCWSMMFQIFIERYGTVEQKRKLRTLLSELMMQL